MQIYKSQMYQPFQAFTHEFDALEHTLDEISILVFPVSCSIMSGAIRINIWQLYSSLKIAQKVAVAQISHQRIHLTQGYLFHYFSASMDYILQNLPPFHHRPIKDHHGLMYT